MDYITQQELDQILIKHKAWLDESVSGERAVFRDAFFSNVDLCDSSIKFAEFRNCEFQMLRISGSQLGNSLFENCIFSDVGFYDCNAYGCSFTKCKMTDCRILDCRLVASSFSGSTLNSVMFCGSCLLNKANFLESTIRNCNGLHYAECSFVGMGHDGSLLGVLCGDEISYFSACESMNGESIIEWIKQRPESRQIAVDFVNARIKESSSKNK